MNKKLIVILIAVTLAGFAGYNYLFKGHRDIASEKAEFTVTAMVLSAEFLSEEKAANFKYADKTVIVTGQVTAIDLVANTVMVDGKLSALMTEKSANYRMNSKVKLKGRVVGFDDILGEVKMDQAIIIE